MATAANTNPDVQRFADDIAQKIAAQLATTTTAASTEDESNSGAANGTYETTSTVNSFQVALDQYSITKADAANGQLTFPTIANPTIIGNTSITGRTTITGNTSFDGDVILITANTVSVNASISLLRTITANGSNGSVGQFLTSAGSNAVYWSTLTLPPTPTLHSVLTAGSTSNSTIGVGNTTITGTANITGRTIMGPLAGSTTSTSTGSLELRNTGGTGDSDVASMSYYCNGQYGINQHLRADGYFGLGGWSVSAWRWYINMNNGDMTAAGNITAYSDPRLKEDITPIESALSKVMGWRGVKYRWKQDSVIGHPGKYDYGILSPDIEKTAPELVVDSLWKSPEGDFYKTVAYDKLAPFLIEAIKEQQKQIEELKTQVIALQQAIE